MTHSDLLSTAAVFGIQYRYWIIIIIVIAVLLALAYYARGRASGGRM